jgi:hypothetical protein
LSFPSGVLIRASRPLEPYRMIASIARFESTEGLFINNTLV